MSTVDDETPDDDAAAPLEEPAPGDSATQTAFSKPPDHVLIRRFEVRVVGGPDQGKRFKSKGERTIVGKHESADFVYPTRPYRAFTSRSRSRMGARSCATSAAEMAAHARLG